MTVAKAIPTLAVIGAVGALLLCAPAASLAGRAGATHAGAAGTTPTAAERKLLQSPQLWATIDVCNPSDQPNTVGVRGSMPGDEHSQDEMYMRFRLQYLDSSTKQWIDLPNGAESGYVAVGAAKSARQTGRSFQLVPVAGKPAVTLRGVVSFQWRHGIDRRVHRLTTDHRRARQPRGRRPEGLQRGRMPAQLSVNRRGSFVMIPSTPSAVSLAICAASSTVQA